MQGESDRDRAIDQALRDTFQTPMNMPTTRSTGECLDADVLAAWSEGALSRDRAAAVESHLSECTRCQQMLAVFARTAPEPIAPEPLWRRWRLQWLVPIATAATAAAIWVASPGQDKTSVAPPVSDRAVALNTPSTASQPAERAEPAREAPPAAAPARLRAAPEAEGKAQKKPVEEQAAAAAPTALPAPSLQKRESLERRDAATGTLQPAPRAQAEADSDLRARANDTFSPQPEPLDKRPASLPAAEAAAPAAAAPASPVSPAQPARGGIRALGDATRLVAAPEIASPDARIRWRITGGRQVERTTNDGAQWQPATMPAATALTAGMSPSSSVCWIVGRAGAVYVTADGLRFVRVNFPEAIDLVSVTATDDRHATVMSADGRAFRTQDQGANWTR